MLLILPIGIQISIRGNSITFKSFVLDLEMKLEVLGSADPILVFHARPIAGSGFDLLEFIVYETIAYDL